MIMTKKTKKTKKNTAAKAAVGKNKKTTSRRTSAPKPQSKAVAKAVSKTKKKAKKTPKAPSKVVASKSKEKLSLIQRLVVVLKKRIENFKPGKAKRVPSGRTLKTADEFLPKEKGKVKQLKDKRWVVVVDSNSKNELAVVRLTDENQPNSTPLPTYKKGNKRDTYFKHFVEVEDDKGNPIIATKAGKFQENSKKYDLTKKEVDMVKSKVFRHCKQAASNHEKVENLKNGKKNSPR